MVFYKDNKWHISDLKVTYKDGEETTEKSVGLEGKKWWVELEKAHDYIQIIKFEELTATDEQIQRLENINLAGIPDGYGSIVSNYVKLGKFPDEFNHPLKDIENEEINREQGIDLSEREIEALYLAMQVSDLEIQILEIGGAL